jgi:hypothetical protein
MEIITQDHYPNYLKEKKFMKSKQSSNTNKEEEDTNIIGAATLIEKK